MCTLVYKSKLFNLFGRNLLAAQLQHYQLYANNPHEVHTDRVPRDSANADAAGTNHSG